MLKKLTLAATAFLAFGAYAELKLDSVFSSNMVLQQKEPVSFFGTSTDDAAVRATFNGNTIEAIPDASGNWRVTFPAMDASHTEYEASFSNGKNSVELKNLLVGEVWFCSGQSNMAMPIQNHPVDNWSAQDCEAVVAAADHPELRYACQRTIPSNWKRLRAQYQFGNGWVKCSPEIAGKFGAVAYFFGLELHKALDVPVGLVNASWGGTRIQTWISYEGYSNANLTNDVQAKDKFNMTEEQKAGYIKEVNETYTKNLSTWYQSAFKDLDAKSWPGFYEESYDDTAWKPVSAVVPRQHIILWSRAYYDVPEKYRGQDLLLVIPKIGDIAEIYLNGEKIGGWNTETSLLDKNTALRIPANKIHERNTVALCTWHFYGRNSSQDLRNIEGGIKFGTGKDMPVVRGWKSKEAYSLAPNTLPAPPAFPYSPFTDPQFQSNLYDGMVHAWTKLPFRGIIWYQGCSNAGQPSYLKYHKALINDWRAKWNKPDMPFLIVQLAGYEPLHAKDWMTSDPNRPSSFALTRDIQMKMLSLKNVGLACAMDIGDPIRIHPANKQDVGKRLALEARRIAYGENIVSQGPIFDKAVPEGNFVRVFFKNATALKTSDGKAPGAFAVAGEDRHFVWAEAKIDGNTVLVSSPDVPSPKFVRYAYVGYRGDCNLQNQEGLPAYPFLSDADNSNL